MIGDLGLKNPEVCGMDIQEFFKRHKVGSAWLCARGFPDLLPLVKLLTKELVQAVLVFTSTTKIKKTKKP